MAAAGLECVEVFVRPEVSNEAISILKPRWRKQPHPYVAFKGTERSELEYVNGRDPARRVIIRLPEGHSEKAPTRRATMSRKRSSRKGLNLADLRLMYQTSCAQYGCPILPQILQTFEHQQRTTGTPPPLLTLNGVSNVSAEQFAAFCDIIVQDGALRAIELQDVGLRDKYLERLVQALLFRRSVERVNLSDNTRIGREGLKYLSIALSRSVFLTYLNVSGIPFTSKMAAVFKDCLPSCRLRTLIMHRCGLKSTSVLGPIVTGMTGCQPLCNVSFKSNGIGSEGAKWLANLLQVDTLITCLDLRCNQLDDAGTRILARGLATNNRLEKLALYDNRVRGQGAVDICLAVAKNTVLQSLDLSANPLMTTDIMDAVKVMLIRNHALRTLFLWKCGIENEGAVFLAEALAENRTLLRIELRKNSIGPSGLMAFMHCVKLNQTIFKVLLDPPDVDNPEKESMATHLYQEIQRWCGLNLDALQKRETKLAEEETARQLAAQRVTWETPAPAPLDPPSKPETVSATIAPAAPAPAPTAAAIATAPPAAIDPEHGDAEESEYDNVGAEPVAGDGDEEPVADPGEQPADANGTPPVGDAPCDTEAGPATPALEGPVSAPVDQEPEAPSGDAADARQDVGVLVENMLNGALDGEAFEFGATPASATGVELPAPDADEEC